jgi:hypothetical protein
MKGDADQNAVEAQMLETLKIAPFAAVDAVIALSVRSEVQS